MITKYLLEFDVDGREEAVDLTKAGAEELVAEYTGKTVVFKGKDHKIKSGCFDPTRGIVLTDTNGKTFVYATLMDTVHEEGEEEPEKIVKPKKKMGRRKKYRHPTHLVCGEHKCNNCGKKVPEEGHTPKRCEKLGGPSASAEEKPDKIQQKSKSYDPEHNRERAKRRRGDFCQPRVQIDRDVIDEVLSHFDPLLELTTQDIMNYLVKIGVREFRIKHGCDPETGDKLSK
jgi:hypothetical protein